MMLHQRGKKPFVLSHFISSHRHFAPFFLIGKMSESFTWDFFSFFDLAANYLRQPAEELLFGEFSRVN